MLTFKDCCRLLSTEMLEGMLRDDAVGIEPLDLDAIDAICSVLAERYPATKKKPFDEFMAEIMAKKQIP